MSSRSLVKRGSDAGEERNCSCCLACACCCCCLALGCGGRWPRAAACCAAACCCCAAACCCCLTLFSCCWSFCAALFKSTETRTEPSEQPPNPVLIRS